MKNKYFYLSIILLVIGLIGLVSVITNTRNVNSGAFIFPALLSVYFFYVSKRKSNHK